MKKKALYLLAVLTVILTATATNVRAFSFDEPPPLCNPFTDPKCK